MLRRSQVEASAEDAGLNRAGRMRPRVGADLRDCARAARSLRRRDGSRRCAFVRPISGGAGAGPDLACCRATPMRSAFCAPMPRRWAWIRTKWSAASRLKPPKVDRAGPNWYFPRQCPAGRTGRRGRCCSALVLAVGAYAGVVPAVAEAVCRRRRSSRCPHGWRRCAEQAVRRRPPPAARACSRRAPGTAAPPAATGPSAAAAPAAPDQTADVAPGSLRRPTPPAADAAAVPMPRPMRPPTGLAPARQRGRLDPGARPQRPRAVQPYPPQPARPGRSPPAADLLHDHRQCRRDRTDRWTAWSQSTGGPGAVRRDLPLDPDQRGRAGSGTAPGSGIAAATPHHLPERPCPCDRHRRIKSRA